ncbi:MAG: response regulator [Candidatus Omnitrophota bacterium]|nr:response regulator [Candidatus Omnitrophota bacterium]MBU2527864.1 response regulator [bacterium]MBU3929217.1 response regulator [bacterium]MBU4123658.1 response regulator [bacterium]
MDNKKIFVIDDDPHIVELLQVGLENAGYTVLSDSDGSSAVAGVKTKKPDLIILDLMLPGMNGYDICACLKEKEDTALIPIIILSAKDTPPDKITALKLGADEYVTKPFDIDEMVTRVNTLLTRTEYFLDANPLTRLPGNTTIMREAGRRLKLNEPFAFIYVDINNFKAFNDNYGFDRGDEAIKTTAAILRNSADEHNFAGHIGGDDFIFICSPENAEKSCLAIIRDFDSSIQGLYNQEDLERGYIISKDRLGTEQKFPVMTLSIGAVIQDDYTNPVRYGNIVDTATQMKKFAKMNNPGSKSYYAFNKRK